MNFTKLPSFPYPYSGALQFFSFTSQAQRSYRVSFLNGLQEMKSYQKNSTVVDITSNLTRFVLEPYIHGYIRGIFKSLGLVPASEEHLNFDLLPLFIKMMLNRIHIEYLSQQTGDNEYELRQQIEKLEQEEEVLQRSFFEVRQQFLEFCSRPEQTLAPKTLFLNWIPMVLSTIITDAIYYPLQVVGYWLVATPGETSWMSSYRNLKDQVLSGNKNIYDGFLVQCVATMCHHWMIIPPMLLCKRLMGLPDEIKMRYYFGFLLTHLFSEKLNPLNLPEETIRQELHFAFTTVLKNSVAYCISDWAVRLALYPLATLRNRLACQGCSTSCPSEHHSTLAAFRFLRSTNSFYYGILGKVVSIVPELMAWGVVYVAGHILITHCVTIAPPKPVSASEYLPSFVPQQSHKERIASLIE